MKKIFLSVLASFTFSLTSVAAYAAGEGDTEIFHFPPEVVGLDVSKLASPPPVSAPKILKKCSARRPIRQVNGTVLSSEKQRYFYSADYIHLMSYGGIKGISNTELCSMVEDVLKKKLEVPMEIFGCEAPLVADVPPMISDCTIHIAYKMLGSVPSVGMSDKNFLSSAYYAYEFYHSDPSVGAKFSVQKTIGYFPEVIPFSYRWNEEEITRLKNNMPSQLEFNLQDFVTKVNQINSDANGN